MQTVSSWLIGASVTLLAGLGSDGAGAAGIQLPPETVTLKSSSLPGFKIASQKCAICHSADYIAYQPPGMNQTQWTAEAAKMHATYGAPIDAAEIRLVGIYLTATYGDSRSITPADLASNDVASGADGGNGGSVTAASSAEAPIDVQALLGKNACLSCHALQQKIVGPGYHDVAAKYRSDPQALTKIQASIRQGGSGRWGSVPMPPFPGLSASELKALAAFILGQ